jgi:hypothetical protein
MNVSCQQSPGFGERQQVTDSVTAFWSHAHLYPDWQVNTPFMLPRSPWHTLLEGKSTQVDAQDPSILRQEAVRKLPSKVMVLQLCS